MVVDSAALVILRQEPEAARFSARDPVRLISAANSWRQELPTTNLSECRPAAGCVRRAGPNCIEAVTSAGPHRAPSLPRFRPRQSSGPAQFRRPLAYALAKATGEPLLFKGDDFARPTSDPPRGSG